MTAKKSDYIIIYCFLFASILCIAVMARLFVVKELQLDEFSGTVAFVVACLLLGNRVTIMQQKQNKGITLEFRKIESIFALEFRKNTLIIALEK